MEGASVDGEAPGSRDAEEQHEITHLVRGDGGGGAMPPVMQEIVPMKRGVFTQQEITKFLIRSEDDMVGIEDDITNGGMDGVVDGGTGHPRIEQGKDGMQLSKNIEHYENENENENAENTENTLEGGRVVSQPDCQFRRGYCTKHNIKGTKTVTNSKKWTKKKHGYGWSTIRRLRSLVTRGWSPQSYQHYRPV